MTKSLGVLALLIAGCTLDTGGDFTIDNGGDMHEPNPGLMEGIGPGLVGGPFLDLPPAAAAAVSPVGLGPLKRLIRFNVNDPGNPSQIVTKDPQIITASINAQMTFAPAPATLSPGPIEAVLEWGSGNGSGTVAIVDVPINATEGRGGILVSVLGTYLEVNARNNANLLPRVGDAVIGNPNSTPVPKAGVSLAIGPRAGGSTPVTLTRFAAFNPAGGLAAAATGGVTVPPLARAFTVFRTDATQPIQISVTTSGNALDGPYNVAANVAAPRIVLPTNAIGVNITNTGAAALTAVGVIFEIAL